ncbi:MAG TPA: hypothetical protein P5531_13780 [Bacteroidales bacterium]|nr:hypothetical protein [Bacteroidales bacterium]HSA44662.1 hypothetical protein [Bacteroidales bacterium]
MRRQSRYIINWALVVGGSVAILDVIIQWLEHQNSGKKFNWENYNGWRTVKNAAVGSMIGAGIGSIIYEYKICEEAKIPFNSDGYLKKVLTREHLKANPDVFQRVVELRAEVKQFLTNKFENKLVSLPEDTGSFHKRTAISSSYDLDIVLPFKRSSYNTLEEMFNNVYESIGEAYGKMACISKQTKTIGITFENNGNPIHFDVVPGREISNYIEERDLNLFVNPDWIWQKGSSFKTNIGIQKSITVNKPEARTAIKLLKLYRERNNLILPSVIIDQCVVEALSNNNFGVTGSITWNLLNCMLFISKKLEQRSLIDIANTNNNLQGKLNEIQKSHLVSQLQMDRAQIYENPRYIKEIFEC